MQDLFGSWLDLNSLLQLLNAHPQWAVIGAFLTSFIESLAIIGAIMPGAIFMSVIGFLIATAVLDGAIIYPALAVGAVLGNLLSFVFGRYFSNFVRNSRFFRKNPQMFCNSEQFFKRHGGKSLFIGQFLGPIRAVLPMSAGMLNMSYARFLLVSIPAALVWSVAYTMPGFLLGALSAELPPGAMAKFAGVSLLLLALLWSLIWVVQFCCSALWRGWCSWAQRRWNKLVALVAQVKKQDEPSAVTRERSGAWWAVRLTLRLASRLVQLLAGTAVEQNDNRSDSSYNLNIIGNGGRQLIRLDLFLLLLLLFGGLFWLRVQPWWVSFEAGLYYFMQNCRSQLLEPIMMALSLLGNECWLLCIGGLVLLWMLYKHYYYLALHWLVLLGGFFSSAFALKMLMQLPRPPCFTPGQHFGIGLDYSFPSGHAVASVVLFGGLSALIAQTCSKNSRRVRIGVILLVSCITFSRLYLGAHWLADLLAGLLLGGIWLLAMLISYHRRDDEVASQPAVAAVRMADKALTADVAIDATTRSIDSQALLKFVGISILFLYPLYAYYAWPAFSQQNSLAYPIITTTLPVLKIDGVQPEAGQSRANDIAYYIDQIGGVSSLAGIGRVSRIRELANLAHIGSLSQIKHIAKIENIGRINQLEAVESIGYISGVGSLGGGSCSHTGRQGTESSISSYTVGAINSGEPAANAAVRKTARQLGCLIEAPLLPAFRLNRLGQALEPFNLLLVGDLQTFSQALTDLGWQIVPATNGLRNLLQTLFGISLRHHRYLFLQQYRGNNLQLVAAKATAREDVYVVLQLWPARIQLLHDHRPVWIGNISFHDKQLPLVTKRGLQSLFDISYSLSALNELGVSTAHLVQSGFTVTKVQLDLIGQSKQLSIARNKRFEWNGGRLIIEQQLEPGGVSKE